MGTAALALRGRGTAPTGHCDRRRRADEEAGSRRNEAHDWGFPPTFR